LPDEAVALLPSAEDTLLPNFLASAPMTELQSVQDKLRQFVFGRTGSGKTRYAGTAALIPEMCPVIFFDMGGGEYKTLKTLQRENPTIRLDITRVDPGQYRRKKDGEIIRLTGPAKWEHTEEIYEDTKLKMGLGKLDVKTIIIDTYTEAYDLCMEWWLFKEYSKDAGRDIDLPGAAGGRDDFGRDWNKVRAIVRKMLRGFRDLGTHIILTGHDKEVPDRTNKSMILDLPAFPGQLANDVPGYIDEVHYMYTKDGPIVEGTPTVDHRLQCQPTNIRPSCKSRGGLPIVVANNPTVQEIVDLAEIPLL
jgi:hypothetical protein